MQKKYLLSGIQKVEDGKRFESYLGQAFFKEIGCDKYYQGVNFSLKEEKDYILSILNKQNIEDNEKN